MTSIFDTNSVAEVAERHLVVDLQNSYWNSIFPSPFLATKNNLGAVPQSLASKLVMLWPI